uniref:CRIB domain-containing protein n=1 Tax=Acrobeloides nanus TaxID=290746 RepID=A0A914CXF1_9BILA
MLSLPLPNGEYWRGALRSGQTGLFKPSETVAYLGAENPAPSLDSKLLKSPANVKKSSKSASKLPPEKKKLLISEPQGEVLHTCHVGIDGKSFGLLQVDKNELAKALPPTINIPNGTISNSKTSPKSTASNDSSSLIIATAPPRPAPRKVHNVPTPTVSPFPTEAPGQIRQISSERSFKPPPPPPPSTSPPLPAPALPPKPAARVQPTHKTMSQVENFVNPPLPRRTLSTNAGEDFARRKELLADLARNRTSDLVTMSDTSAESSLSTAETMLDNVLRELQQDITDFSFSSVDSSMETSDKKPLLSPTDIKYRSNGKNSALIDLDSVVRIMTPEEAERWDKRSDAEHKRADRKLEAERGVEIKTFQKLASKNLELEQEDSLDSSTASIPSSSGNFRYEKS